MNTHALAVSNHQMVALSPPELPLAQREVADWCRAKIVALSHDLREQRQNDAEARKMLWRNGWPAQIRKTVRLMTYYAKLQKAIASGYLIVPNFNVDVVAVRVGREKPRRETKSHDEIRATPDLLPPGQGRYVDDILCVTDASYQTKNPADGSMRNHSAFIADEYDDAFEFPAALVKPQILAATDRAMALRLFDRIGVVRASRRSDPIVVGQIVDPRERYNPYNTRCVSFFVAWWLDTGVL